MICIYKIKNPKDKIYIGQTKNLKQRLYNYNNPNPNYIGRKLYNSIKKYGWENHKIEIIEEILNSEHLQNKLDEREIYYIKKYNSNKEGLNLTGGGNGGKPSKEVINKRIKTSTNKVLQYDLDNNLIKEWKSLGEIEKTLGFKKETIRFCINGITNISYGYRWKYKNKDTNKWESKVKKVNQYTLDGNFIKTWNSVKDCKQWLGKGDISGCLEGRQKTAGKFIWKYVEI
jgi:hypothetical protein